jgi:hypothetical protein
MITPLSLARPFSVNELEQLVTDLQHMVRERDERIAALESRKTPPLEPLREHNAKRQADAERLRTEIESIAAESPPGQRLTAKRILCILRRIHGDKAPSERTVRLHLATIRQRQHGRDAARTEHSQIVTRYHRAS